MNITHCLAKDTTGISPIKCPQCHLTHVRKHGAYTRKGFHVLKKSHKIPMEVKRYRCLNPDCPVCTFSVLPCCVLRYCRFFYTGLLQVKNALSAGIPLCRLARLVWNVGTGVIKRAAAELSGMDFWIMRTCREISDGRVVDKFNAMVKFSTRRLGHIDLTERYGYYRYPHRLRSAK